MKKVLWRKRLANINKQNIISMDVKLNSQNRKGVGGKLIKEII